MRWCVVFECELIAVVVLFVCVRVGQQKNHEEAGRRVEAGGADTHVHECGHPGTQFEAPRFDAVKGG